MKSNSRKTLDTLVERAMMFSLSSAYGTATRDNKASFDKALEEAMDASVAEEVSDEHCDALGNVLEAAMHKVKTGRRGNARGREKDTLRYKLELHYAGGFGLKYNKKYANVSDEGKAIFECILAETKRLLKRKRVTMAQLETAKIVLEAACAEVTKQFVNNN